MMSGPEMKLMKRIASAWRDQWNFSSSSLNFITCC